MRYQKQYDFKVRDSVFTTGTHVMAILNVTPDSFGRAAVTRTMRLKPRANLSSKAQR